MVALAGATTTVRTAAVDVVDAMVPLRELVTAQV
jgi:hypothetical protein